MESSANAYWKDAPAPDASTTVTKNLRYSGIQNTLEFAGAVFCMTINALVATNPVCTSEIMPVPGAALTNLW
jgi:hypothetical protein